MIPASVSARWSAQRIMFLSPTFPISFPAVTHTGAPTRFVTANEHVASNPIPPMRDLGILAVSRHARVVWQMARQISVVDCSKIRASVSERQVVVDWVDEARMVPLLETNAARADPVPLVHFRAEGE